MSSKPPRSGPSRSAEPLPFAKLGIRREQDLPLHLPIRYEDETRIVPVAEVRPGETVQVEGRVARTEIVPRPRRMLLVELRDDAGDRIDLRFFNFWGSQLKQFSSGRRVRAHGEARGGLFGLELVHPRWRLVDEGEAVPDRLTPVYSTVSGIGQARIRSAVLGALRRLAWPETVPPDVVRRLGLPQVADALRALHQPAPGVSLEALQERATPEWRRVIFDELLAQQLSLKRARAARASLAAPALASRDAVGKLLGALPFRLTGAQQRAWAEVAADLARAQPMNRLLQGDVGSGKTVIAALAAAQAIGSGWQAAMMAPTELLAEQHLRKLEPWLKAIGARIAWLSGSLRESEKKAVRAAVAAGEVDLLVGTHALIEDTVGFARLGLAIVDEQHRFGVAQRLALRAKLENPAGAAAGSATAGGPGAGTRLLPHQLMMSATPIPRTLAMSYYADLDVSVIDELPPGRTPVVTKLVSEARRDEVIDRLRAAAAAGRQVYWVCPLIEESESLDLQTAIDTHARLTEELAPIRVGLVHGRMAPADKQAVMDGFVRGEIQVLVATTVIEVGVDVPNASLMIIEHAERFGLAQLHQLRGRVGRGSTESFCVLMYRNPLSATARERLRTMYETTDGFEIARRDLVQRGPGELLGARQSGQMLLRFADLERDSELVAIARETADRMLREDPAAVDAHLERWLGGREEFLKA
ncbi:ATP-dependent DNA helicase RecG [Burkholderiaceae bacterium FT117]|uniref:ATP-dependent DNA helicase RecG n=1 Tax=Zeimonas sediminis TaxID=2944268 RepID=UPI002342DF96|nr:ATP-dependent DNA helicase RecG [Zeimonas sediminis]MCM5569839.1 ATP-dependent DNA helicase RecG [Zeimonas sediminis]